MNSNNQILSFYFDLLFVNSIESLKASFVGNSTLRNRGYEFIPVYDYYMKDEMVEDNGATPIFVTDIIKREDFLNRILVFEKTSILEKIEDKISALDSIPAKQDVLSELYDGLNSLLKRAGKIENDEIFLIESSLLQILNSLKDRYGSILEHHPVFKYLAKESDVTFFKNKDLKYSFYVDLYEVAYSLDIIHDDEIDEVDFINAFTAPNPHLLEKKIRFTQNNFIVAYFLEQLKQFFHGFTHFAIEESKVFHNKQGKPLKSTDIYAALSRGKTKNENEKSKIDSKISDLKSKYLK